MDKEEEEIIQFIREKGRKEKDGKKCIAKSKLKGKHPEKLKQLEEDHLIVVEKRGTGESVCIEEKVSEGNVKIPTPTIQDPQIILMLKDILELLKEINRKLDRVLSNPSDLEARFDSLYEEVKNSFNIARLSEIRKRMGLSQEEFYSKLSDYIERNYRLVSGGDEGVVKGGVIYGMVRKL
ncbi:hypothetical protein [Acidianus sp. RZ1]|uniref:hypothetical protein n=1 Tax=Acidianus sp. RZ1 TaxID=1540082 RepID=UPI0014913A99|nr:hypothetical protein [Acidianus sp. RZ1]NON61425.1 hypothetical protein [Acidianus sp. RZ1]